MSRSPRPIPQQQDEPRRRPSTRRSVRGDATRERILEAAARAFDRRGYLGVNLNDVVQQLGLTKGALYHLIRTELPEPFVGWIERVTQLLETAKVRGQVRTSMDSAAAAQLMVSFFYGAQAVSEHFTERQDLLDRLDTFWELMEPSLRPAHRAP